MPVLTNNRRELFANLLAQGFTAIDAYEKAGFKRHTVESLMDQAETILASAMSGHQYSAAVSALKEKGVLSGKRIERSEIGAPGEFDALTDNELRRMIVERFTALDLSVYLPRSWYAALLPLRTVVLTLVTSRRMLQRWCSNYGHLRQLLLAR